jgi:hypothetical protein
VSLADLTDDQFNLIGHRRIDLFEITTGAGQTGSSAGSFRESFRLKARVHLSRIMADDPPVQGVVTGELRGFILRPNLTLRRTNATLHEVYENPQGHLEPVYPALYESQILRDDVITAVDGRKPGAEYVFVPERHLHIASVRFARGFASPYDLGAMLDHAVEQFFPTSAEDGLVTVAGDAIPEVDLRSAHGVIAGTVLMTPLGFRVHEEFFLHMSGGAKAERQRRSRIAKRLPVQVERRPLA